MMSTSKVPPRAALTEHQIQGQILDALRACGLTVYSTTAYKQKGPSGVDRGVPDLLVCVDGATGLYIGLEVKRPGSWKYSSEEQRQAHDAGRFRIVLSPLDALSTVVTLIDQFVDPYLTIHSVEHATAAQVSKMEHMMIKLREVKP
jgi:hypothetical protein